MIHGMGMVRIFLGGEPGIIGQLVTYFYLLDGGRLPTQLCPWAMVDSNSPLP